MAGRRSVHREPDAKSVDWRMLSGTFRATLARVALPMDYVSLVAALGNRGARHQWHNHQRDARWDGFFHQSGRAVGAAFRHSGRVVCSIWSVEFGVRLCVVQVEPLQASIRSDACVTAAVAGDTFRTTAAPARWLRSRSTWAT